VRKSALLKYFHYFNDSKVFLLPILTFMRNLPFLFISILLISCTTSEKQKVVESTEPVQVELQTTKGTIVLELSDKTPLHRDNFIKIVKDGWLDSMLFHRVLQGFVVQAGEYDSLKVARIDSVEFEAMDYRVPAEFDSTLFHKRGALGAARTGNPERASSSLSFYFVQRGPRADSLIDKDEKRINSWLRDNAFVNAPENKVWKDSLIEAESNGDWEKFYSISNNVSTLAESLEIDPYVIPEYQREIYRTIGGTPHLDQNYTVFGQVIQGMNVVDSIAVVAVNEAGWPVENVYILSAKILTE